MSMLLLLACYLAHAQQPSQQDEALYARISALLRSEPEAGKKLIDSLLQVSLIEKDSLGLGRGYNYKAQYHLGKGELAQAREDYRSGLSVLPPQPDPELLSSLTTGVGLTYMYAGQFDSALSYQLKSLDILPQEGSSKARARVLNNIGTIHQQLNQLPEALEYFEQSLPLHEQAKDTLGKAGVLINMGGIALKQNKHAQARVLAEEGLEMAKQQAYKPFIGTALNILGIICSRQGDYPTALDYYNQSLDLQREAGNQAGMASAYGNRGMVFQEQGKYAEALDQFQQAFDIHESMGNSSLAAGILGNLGSLYRTMGEYDRAKEFLYRAMAIDSTNENLTQVALSLTQLGIICEAQNQWDEAFEKYSKSLAILERTDNQSDRAHAMNLIGSIYAKKGQYDQARMYFEQSIAIHKRVGFPSGIVASYIRLGGMDLRQNRLSSAKTVAQEALQISQEIGSVDLIADAAGLLYRINLAAQNPAEALKMYELHIQMRDSLNRDETRQSVLRQEYQYAYEKQALADSLAFVDEQAATRVAYQAEINQRNLLLSGTLIVILLGMLAFFIFRSRQQKRMQEQAIALATERERKEQLAELDAARTRFFTNLSHEFRTPLTVITGMAEKGAEQPEQFLSSSIKLIHRNAQRLLQLVNQMLNLAKLESGSLQLQKVQGDFIAFAQYLVESFHSYAEAQEITLHLIAEPHELWMDYDPSRMTDVITNLLSNAIKFTPKGGHVYVQVAADEKEVILMVKDTGKGIHPEDLPHVFDRFFQAKNAEIQREEGTGIGLAFTRELVQLMEGNITVESHLDKGSTFTVLLPITQQADRQAHTAASPLVVPSTDQPKVPAEAGEPSDLPRLLIVEDNADVVSYIVSCLQDSYQLSIAGNGREGIEKAIAEVPDLIISDVMMPEADGFELTRTLKTDQRTSHIPIVLLTARADEASRLEGLEGGADAYLEKPFREKELRIRLSKLHELRQRLQQQYGGSPFVSPSEPEPSIEDVFLNKVREVLETHLDDPELDVTRLCELVGMSRAQLHRKLKALTGKSTTQFIREYRLTRARVLLLESDEPVANIGYQTGFSNPNWFTRAFKEVHGMSPTQAREGR